MRILISVLDLSVGGSQINALEIGSRLRGHGHEVLVYAPDGELRARLAGLGLDYVPAHRASLHAPPTRASAGHLTQVVREQRVDLVHAHEWSPTLEAAYGPHLRLGTPLLSTVYATKIPRFVPRHLPMIVGYEDVAEVERRRGRKDVQIVVCPVDTDANAPVAETTPARRRFGLADDELVVVLVSRLAEDLKREGLVAAVRAAGLVDPGLRLRLLIVGDGPCRAELDSAAAAVNAMLGREAVTMAGQMLDPRPAYAAADIVVGMGTSAQKGMAFGKPVIIQGERGYWELLTPRSLPTYLYQNFYGVGAGDDGAPRLAELLTALAHDRAAWAELGTFGRATALSVFSNDIAAQRVLATSAKVAARRQPLRQRAAGVIGATGWFAGFRVVDQWRRTSARVRRSGPAQLGPT